MEREEYWCANLLPCMQQFLRSEYHSEPNNKNWNYCYVLFTAFLYNSLYMIYNNINGGHNLYMEHLRVLYSALSRGERNISSDLHTHTEPGMRVCENRLTELKKLRQGLSPTCPFEIDVFEKGKTMEQKRCRHFCLCLNYIVKRTVLYQHSAEWDATVVCGWFDEYNTEDARAFVRRAEKFFQTYGKAALQEYMEDLPGLSSSTSATSSNPYMIEDTTLGGVAVRRTVLSSPHNSPC